MKREGERRVSYDMAAYHAGGIREKAQSTDCGDEKGDCGNQGKRKKRGLTIAVSPHL